MSNSQRRRDETVECRRVGWSEYWIGDSLRVSWTLWTTCRRICIALRRYTRWFANSSSVQFASIVSSFLSSSKIWSKEMWGGQKKRGGADSEDIGPVYGLQRRGGGCIDITPDWWRSSEYKTHSFFKYLRMAAVMFDKLLQRVGPKIEKHDTNMSGLSYEFLLRRHSCSFRHSCDGGLSPKSISIR